MRKNRHSVQGLQVCGKCHSGCVTQRPTQPVPQQPPLIPAVHHEDDGRLHLSVNAAGYTLRALVDTGSTLSYISQDTARRFRKQGIMRQPAPVRQAQMANGEVATITGRYDVPTTIQSNTRQVTLLCLPTLALPMILGMDALRSFHITISAGSHQVRVHAAVHPDRPTALGAITIPSTGITQLDKLLHEELPLFAHLQGTTPLVTHHIRLKNTTPLKQRYQPRNPKIQAVINDEVDQMLAERVIEPSRSAWSSPAVIVRKKDGKPRFCIDFRRLNDVSEKDAYPLPFINNILEKLRQATIFSTLDLKQGYWQIPLSASSKPLTAFTVPGRGLFQFRVMPFGLHAAPATFQRLLDQVIGPEMDPYAIPYLDDIIVASRTVEEHVRHLREVFRRLRAANLRLNPEKCEFGRRSIRYLGHVISDAGIQTDPEKVEAIQAMTAPTTVKQLRQFLGAASWYRRFVSGFSKIARPLTTLLQKQQRWVWGTEQEEAFHALKHALTTAPALGCPDFSRRFFLQTDASDQGLGAVLVQHTDHGEQVIAYASRTLRGAEPKYSVTEKECLAIVWGVQKMRHYLEGYAFTVVTDHQALRWLHTLDNPPGRLARWAMYLQQFDYQVQYRKGTLNRVADALSRQPLSATPALSTAIHAALPVCPWLQRRQEEVRTNPRKWPDYDIRGQHLYRRIETTNDTGGSEWKLCVPRAERPRVLQENHDHPTGGHGGMAKTAARIAIRYYWPGMFRDVNRYVRQCRQCQQFKVCQQGAAGQMHPPRIHSPWDTVAADIMGPLPASKKGHCYLLVLQDRMTKWVECRALRRATAATITRAFQELVLFRYGCPRTVITDNGTEFANKALRDTLAALRIRHLQTPPYTPQCNPVERVNRVLKTMIAQYCEANQRTWDEHLPELTMAINTSRHESTGYSAAFLNYAREPVMPGLYQEAAHHDDAAPENVNRIPEELRTRLTKLAELRELAKLHLARAAQQQSRHYNLRHREWQPRVGDSVMRREHPLSSAARGFAAKLAPRYSGPWSVWKKISGNVYDLRGTRGQTLRRIHVKDLKPVPTPTACSRAWRPRNAASNARSEFSLQQPPSAVPRTATVSNRNEFSFRHQRSTAWTNHPHHGSGSRPVPVGWEP